MLIDADAVIAFPRMGTLGRPQPDAPLLYNERYRTVYVKSISMECI